MCNPLPYILTLYNINLLLVQADDSFDQTHEGEYQASEQQISQGMLLRYTAKISSTLTYYYFIEETCSPSENPPHNHGICG